MKGSPGFIGDRLRQGREARGLTAIALAGLLDITRQAISLFESGQSTPHPDTLYKIAEKLNFPVSFFITPSTRASSSTVFFRSMAAATKVDRGRGESRIEWLSETIVPYFKQFISFPTVNLPSLKILDNPTNLTDDDIEEIAVHTRREWGLGDGPISNIVRLLENNGIIITRMQLEATTLDAFSRYLASNNSSFIILGDDKKSAVRSRFDTAHETGHIVLHRHINDSQLKNTTLFKVIEKQANRFASALLVPGNKFAEDYTVPTLNAFLTLKSKWLVSVGMLIKRAYDLEFISEEHYQRLWINYNRRGWRKEEPLDSKLPIEQPVLLKRALKLILESGLKTPDQILTELPLSPRDIEALLYISRDYLASSLPKLELKTDIENGDYESALEEVEHIIKGL